MSKTPGSQRKQQSFTMFSLSEIKLLLTDISMESIEMPRIVPGNQGTSKDSQREV